MRPTESFLGQSVRSLQTMLRVIAAGKGRSTSVIPDGIYGKDTAQEVTAFQRRKGLPPTGITDNDTWDAIVSEYEPALILVGEPTPIHVSLQPGQILRRDEAHPQVYLLQALLLVLSDTYASIPKPGISGVLDLATATALEAFQALSDLPATGELDRITWDRLARHYAVAARLLDGTNRENP